MIARIRCGGLIARIRCGGLIARIRYGFAGPAARADPGFRLSWPVVKAHGPVAVTARTLGLFRGFT
ncbi:hypothetical protein FH608_029885 [Nonomuraea phyllanthi]|uniref:Uncharacterized protein n=1 Tax=Nonomuraea phyllanthi TaxID=2219224 RepID=A0A5C4W3V0_9ACTN|nr:hypothetical protein [Nonomuraea phyllanthi]KAB8191473.1 hypothetical protein FH608_029885 [Nonomuraea phyllanthi]